MRLERLVFVHPFLLHYHYPRFQALSEECRKEGIAFTNIELGGYIEIYRTLIKGQDKAFHNVTLFDGQDLAGVPYAQLRRRLEEALEELRPDVVFTFGYSLRIMRRAAAWARKNGVAIGLISDSNDFDTRRRRTFEFLKSLLVSRYDAAFVGGTSSGLYLRQLGLSPDRIVPGYDVVDNGFFRGRSAESRARLPLVREKWGLPDNSFLFVGRLVPNKNIRGLLGAFQRYVESVAGEKPWGLVICGGGPQEEELRATIGAMPAPCRELIQLRGQVTQADLPDFYSAASCFVLPSTSLESWGLVVNEALASALPVLVSDRCGCAADLVREGANGWTFDPGAPGVLARLMRAFHDMDLHERMEMGRRSQEIVAAWGIERFTRAALTSAATAFRRRPGSGGRRAAPERGRTA